VVRDLGGKIPRTAEDLQRLLPGVGRYTAGAIASISYGQVTGVVDGNVIRVLSRLRCIGADFTAPAVSGALWSLANGLADSERPGDFNQAMMELGATVCTPKRALCSECPLRGQCRAYRKVRWEGGGGVSSLIGYGEDNVTEGEDGGQIEDCSLAAPSCPLCIPSCDAWDDALGVANFPRKSAKKPSRLERTLTCVVERRGQPGEAEYLLVQRPQTGLLAGMWEFPSMLLEEDRTEKERADILCRRLQEFIGHQMSGEELQLVGELVHILSHIHQTYLVYFLSVDSAGSLSVEDEERPASRWVTRKQFLDSAVPSAMRKILQLCQSKDLVSGASESTKKRKREVSDRQPPARKVKAEPNKQRSIQSFFKPANRK
ncbi:PREDICTED: adenine DNA glycosylase-like, partial [Nanorana parkeri]|uniref:adenine DNA glycosylase-like n=1 Tax=Nanorana parkeri TaxID=125878 RepID=UPI0008544025